jgi:hypothetical protein
MPLATKNNAIIIKDGKLAENCNCCGAWCLVFKSQGWQGSLAHVDSWVINGDGATFLRSTSLPINAVIGSILPLGLGGVGLSLLVDESLVRATLTYQGSELVLERTGSHGLLSSDVVELGQQHVVSNTFPTTPDEYNKKPIDTVGSLFFKIERSPGTQGQFGTNQCFVGCEPNFFDPSAAISTPETMTLSFTNTAARPHGPRWPSPGRPYYGGFGEYAIGKYAGFLPPNSVIEYFTPYTVRNGCDANMPRFSQPIVMRRVQGTNYTYLSDPILIKPCDRVRYRFDACAACLGYSCTHTPRLSVYPVDQNTRWTLPVTALINGDYPLGTWGRAAYLTSPASWQSEKDSFVYHFGNFATVSPGGDYAPEATTVCGGDAQSNWSDAEGCLGSKCPPAEVIVTIPEGGDLPIAGSYSLPVTNQFCLNDYGSFIPDNYFGGFRGFYGATFGIGSYDLTLGVQRNASSGFFFTAGDYCGCDGRPVYLSTVYFRPKGDPVIGSAALNAPRPDDAGSCVPMCSNSETSLTYSNIALQRRNDGPSDFPRVGTVTVRIPAS